MKYKKHKNRLLRHIIALPFIYIIIVPLLLLDILVELYHHIGFKLYNIPLVKRSDFIAIDRHKLNYLNPIQKLNCVYCGYANGLRGSGNPPRPR